MNNAILKALDVARRDGATNASFGFIRLAQSLTQQAVGSSTDLSNQNIQRVDFELTRRKSDPTNLVENLLPEADGFIITHIRLGILQVLTGEKPQNVKTHYFVNPGVFDSTQAPGLRQIFNGKIFVETANTRLNSQGWPVSALQRSTSFNEGQQIVADTPDASLNSSAYPEALYGAMPVYPLIRIGGVNRTVLSIVLPEAVSCASATGTTETDLVLDVYGVAVPGAALKYDGMFLLS